MSYIGARQNNKQTDSNRQINKLDMKSINTHL